MATVDLLNINAEKVSQVNLPETIFDVPVKSCVLHEVVTMQLAGRRSGSASVKHRSDVRGSGKKLFRQKGTGRARRGDIKAPLLRGGGSVFGPDPKSYAYKVSKKVRKLALRMALTTKLNEDQLLILDKFELEQVKTKNFVEIMRRLGIDKGLIITEEYNENLILSSRNLSKVKILGCEALNVYDVLKYDKLILLEPTLKKIEERLQA
ncbi:MAG TPA: 50S ribosomal protein L4 [Desulfobacteraceae bacterium]|nr:50S ribosomal protein L4 [Desulfobacteraceae bacterium]